MARSIRDYLSDGTYVSYRQIKERFGDPKQIAADYISSLEPDEIAGNLKAGSHIQKVIAAAALAAVLLWGGHLAAYHLVNSSTPDQAMVEEGSYIKTGTERMHSLSSGEITGSKVYAHYNGDGSAAWVVELTGTFAYSGSAAACRASHVGVDIQDPFWYVVSKSVGKAGDHATAAVTMGHKTLGITTMKIPVDLTLSCDEKGDLD